MEAFEQTTHSKRAYHFIIIDRFFSQKVHADFYLCKVEYQLVISFWKEFQISYKMRHTWKLKLYSDVKNVARSEFIQTKWSDFGKIVPLFLYLNSESSIKVKDEIIDNISLTRGAEIAKYACSASECG